MPDLDRDFATVLRNAVEDRGLGLERLRDHLEQRGVSLSVATLSYWQSGRSRPERRSSLAALPHLEQVLRLPPGSLHAPLSVPAQRRRRTQVQALDALWPEAARTHVLAQLDTRWDAELDRLSVHDRLTLGPDRRQHSMIVRQVMRARVDGPDRRVVMHCHEDPAAGLPELRAVRGCTLGRTAGDEAGGALAAELLFLRPLTRGQTVVTEYEVVFTGTGPLEHAYVRRSRVPATEYLLEVQFDPAAVPARCEAVRPDGAITPLELDAAHGAHLFVGADRSASGLDAADAVGMRWAWPDDGRTAEVNC